MIAEMREWDRFSDAQRDHIYALQKKGITVRWDPRKGHFAAGGAVLGARYWNRWRGERFKKRRGDVVT